MPVSSPTGPSPLITLLSFHSHFTHLIMIHLKRLLSLLVNRQVGHSWAWRTTWLNWAGAPAERKQPGGQITLKTSSQKDKTASPEMVVYSKVVHEWAICSRPSLTQLMFHMASASHLLCWVTFRGNISNFYTSPLRTRRPRQRDKPHCLASPRTCPCHWVWQ